MSRMVIYGLRTFQSKWSEATVISEGWTEYCYLPASPTKYQPTLTIWYQSKSSSLGCMFPYLLTHDSLVIQSVLCFQCPWDTPQIQWTISQERTTACWSHLKSLCGEVRQHLEWYKIYQGKGLIDWVRLNVLNQSIPFLDISSVAPIIV